MNSLASLLPRMIAAESARIPGETEQTTERYLHTQIPLAVAMGVRVRLATPRQVVLFAPLAPNINHHATVFGGSGAALATLSAWTLLHLRLQEYELRAGLVIQRSTMEYERPIPGDFSAVCSFDDDPSWRRFQTTMARRGRARMTLTASLCHESRPMAKFIGDFVALRES